MYKAITHGLFNPIVVNKKFMEVWKAIEEIRKQLNEQAETADESVQVIDEPEPKAKTVDTASEIDGDTWRDIKDPAVLKEFALENWGYEIKGNKKAETIIEEIDKKLRAFIKQEG